MELINIEGLTVSGAGNPQAREPQGGGASRTPRALSVPPGTIRVTARGTGQLGYRRSVLPNGTGLLPSLDTAWGTVARYRQGNPSNNFKKFHRRLKAEYKAPPPGGDLEKSWLDLR